MSLNLYCAECGRQALLFEARISRSGKGADLCNACGPMVVARWLKSGADRRRVIATAAWLEEADLQLAEAEAKRIAAALELADERGWISRGKAAQHLKSTAASTAARMGHSLSEWRSGPHAEWSATCQACLAHVIVSPRSMGPSTRGPALANECKPAAHIPPMEAPATAPVHGPAPFGGGWFGGWVAPRPVTKP